MKSYSPLYRVAQHAIIFLSLIFSLSYSFVAEAAPSSQSDDPVVQCAEGWRLYENDDYEGAFPLLENGYLNREHGTFIDPEALGNCAMALGIVYESYSRPEAALDAEIFALDIFETHELPRGIATTLGEMGRAYFDLAQYEQALDYYQLSIDAWEKIGDQQYKGRVIHAMSEVYRKHGQYALALDLLQQALAIAQSVSDQEAEANILGDIGRLYDEQGQPREALKYLEQALKIQEQINNLSGKGSVLGNIGHAYESLRNNTEALKYYQEALTISQSLQDPQNEAIVLSNIGSIYQSQMQYDEALKYFQKALSIQQSIHDSAGEATTLNNIAGNYHLEGKYPQAIQYYQQALKIVQEIGYREGEARTLNNIGMAYQAQGLLPDAVAALDQSMQVVESLRATAINDTARASYIEQYANLYDVAIVLHYQLDEHEQAFQTSEQARARAFLDSLTTGQIKFSNEQEIALYAQEQESYAAILTAQQALSAAKSKNPPNEELIKQRQAELTQAEKEHQDVLEEVRTRGDQLQQLIPGATSVLSLRQTLAFLEDDVTLLSFWIMDDSVVVFIVTHTTFTPTYIPIDPKELTAKIEAFRSFDTTSTPYPKPAVDLYHILIDPLKPYLNTSHLIIVPQGELHYLPFAALTDGERYLMDDYIISYLPSASTLPFVQRNTQKTTGQALILGNPDTGDYDPAQSYFQRDQLGPLPYAEKEVTDIARDLGVMPYLQSDATETIVKQLAPQTKILHLAAHGIFNPVSPLDSLIALTSDTENDGWLTVGEVYGLDLQNTSLVVLSACETQMGQLTAGDEFVGLTRALFFAGTPTVIASLWSVDDEATSLLMERFYAHLDEGLSKGEALREAQIDTRAQYPNPYYWAAFVLNGDAGILDKEEIITATAVPSLAPTSTQVTAPVPPTLPGTPAPERVPNCSLGMLLVLFIGGVIRFSRMLGDR